MIGIMDIGNLPPSEMREVHGEQDLILTGLLLVCVCKKDSKYDLKDVRRLEEVSWSEKYYKTSYPKHRGVPIECYL